MITIIAITEEEEQKLDHGFLMTRKGDQQFTIESDKIICYGIIDFHTNSNDFNYIENMKWLDFVSGLGIPVPSDYNFEEHCCYSPTQKFRYYDTSNPAVLAQYNYAKLGKPERCCIFKEIINNVRRTL